MTEMLILIEQRREEEHGYRRGYLRIIGKSSLGPYSHGMIPKRKESIVSALYDSPLDSQWSAFGAPRLEQPCFTQLQISGSEALPHLAFQEQQEFKPYPFVDLSFISKAEKALVLFSNSIKHIEGIEGMFCNFRELADHRPVIDVWVVIPKSNREREYEIYDKFGELMRNKTHLLFDFHIVKRRGRNLAEVIPKEFREFR